MRNAFLTALVAVTLQSAPARAQGYNPEDCHEAHPVARAVIGPAATVYLCGDGLPLRAMEPNGVPTCPEEQVADEVRHYLDATDRSELADPAKRLAEAWEKSLEQLRVRNISRCRIDYLGKASGVFKTQAAHLKSVREEAEAAAEARSKPAPAAPNTANVEEAKRLRQEELKALREARKDLHLKRGAKKADPPAK